MLNESLLINTSSNKYSKQFWLLMSVCFINSMAQMITVFISLFLHKNHLSIDKIGLLIGLFGIGGIIGGYAGGYISDYISPLKITRYSSLLNAVTIILFTLSTNFFYISIILLIMGLANNLFRPASLLLILGFDKIGKPSIIMSIRRVFVNLGTAVGVMISGILFKYDPIFVFIVCSSIVFISYILLQFVKTDYNKIKKLQNAESNKYNLNLYLAMFMLFLSLIIYNQQQTTYSIF